MPFECLHYDNSNGFGRKPRRQPVLHPHVASNLPSPKLLFCLESTRSYIGTVDHPATPEAQASSYISPRTVVKRSSTTRLYIHLALIHNISFRRYAFHSAMLPFPKAQQRKVQLFRLLRVCRRRYRPVPPLVSARSSPELGNTKHDTKTSFQSKRVVAVS